MPDWVEPSILRGLATGERMAIEDDDKPRKKVTHEIGQDLSLLSVEELTERIALMTSEIERLAGPDQGCGKADGVKRHVILAEELDVSDVVGLQPPAAPIATGWIGFGPLLGCRDVADRRIKPDVKHLVVRIPHAALIRNTLLTPKAADFFDAKQQAVNCNDGARIKCTVGSLLSELTTGM
jgi:uncharacterized small protein (DUF1192 family)